MTGEYIVTVPLNEYDALRIFKRNHESKRERELIISFRVFLEYITFSDRRDIDRKIADLNRLMNEYERIEDINEAARKS